MLTKPTGPAARAILQVFRQRNMGWASCVSEWIDNSIGNGATRIVVSWYPGNPARIDVIDNGNGCTDKMFAALVSIGWHQEDDGVQNRVSRYGVGAKDSFLWCQGLTKCYSRRGNDCLFIEVDWDSFEEEWGFDDPTGGVRAEGLCANAGLNENGVLIQQNHNRQINPKIFDYIRESLAKTYWAAVETGVQIDVRFYHKGPKKKPLGGLLPGRPMPTFADGGAMSQDVLLADGRSIRIDGGILESGQRMSDPGFEYLYGHRVVIRAGGLGSGGMNFERCYFRIVLLGDKTDWKVNTNKDGLHDADEAALGQAVFDACKPLLEKAGSSEYGSVLDRQLLDDLSNRLTEANRKRGKRSARANQTGAVIPTGKGSRHENASRTSDKEGNCRTTRGASKIDIRDSEFGDDDAHLVGKALVRDRLIRLNRRHEYVRQAFERRDAAVIFNIAMALWADAYVNSDANGQMRHIPRQQFSEKLSSMLLDEVANL